MPETTKDNLEHLLIKTKDGFITTKEYTDAMIAHAETERRENYLREIYSGIATYIYSYPGTTRWIWRGGDRYLHLMENTLGGYIELSLGLKCRDFIMISDYEWGWIDDDGYLHIMKYKDGTNKTTKPPEWIDLAKENQND